MSAVTQMRRRGGVTAAASAGRRELLVALRDRIASDIDDGIPPRDLAALSRRLLEISAELESMDAAEDDISRAASMPDEVWNAE